MTTDDDATLEIMDEIAIKEKEEAKKLEEAMGEGLAQTTLLDFVSDRYHTAKDARDNSGLTQQMIQQALDRTSEYSESKLSHLRLNNQPEIYMPVTETKCNNAMAWLQDIENSVGNKSIVIKPTPVPDLGAIVDATIEDKIRTKMIADLQAGGEVPSPEDVNEARAEITDQVNAEIKREASERADKMYDKINDDLLEGDWLEKKKEFRSNCVTFGFGFLKGPMVRTRRELCWDENGNYVEKTVYFKEPDAPSPLDMYWPPSAKGVNDGYMIERIRDVTKDDLNEWKNYPDYQKDNINALIAENPAGVRDLEDDEGNGDSRNRIERKDTVELSADGMFECYEYWGEISGKTLTENGGVQGLDITKDYAFQIIWCKNNVIKIMANPDPTGASIYHKAIFKIIPGSFIGKSVPALVKSAQDMGNSSGRSIVWNMGLSSGAQIDVDLNQLEPNVDYTVMYPGKVWPTRSKPGMTRKAIEFFQATDNTQHLMGVYNWAISLADDSSGVPQYGYGGDTGKGAAKTSSGLAMLLNASSRGLKDSMMSMDLAIASYVRRMFTLEMLFGEDNSIKGDCKVIVKGSMGVLLKELQQARIVEFLDRIMSPMAMEVLGPETFVKAMNEYADLIQLDSEHLLPSWDEVKQRLDAQQAQQQADMQAQQQLQAQTEQGKAAEAAGKQETDSRGMTVREDDQKRKNAVSISKIEEDVNKRITDEIERFKTASMGKSEKTT
jgi:hypothetical protein